jgi:L-alanine-DL-glutamate epimerase-like enolase superfamily enzyme
VRLEVTPLTLHLRAPFEASYGSVSERSLLQVSLSGSDGIAGHGEAAPLEPYDGIAIERVRGALERYRPALEEAEGLSEREALDACRAIDDLPQALAAIDLALWDRAGRLRGEPVALLIAERLAAGAEDAAGAAPLGEVRVNAVVSATDRAGAAEQAAVACSAGFTCLKLKVGVGDDAGRVAAVRAVAGPHVDLRLDANGAWGVEEAVRAIDALEPAGLELVEEPAAGLSAISEVRERVAVRVAIDETAAEPGALAAGAADAVCLKISRCGGISGLLDAAALVAASGAESYLASTLDGPLGIAAALHAAAALGSNRALPACGLATLSLFAGIDDPLPVRNGSIALPLAPGLGLERPAS